MIGFHVISSCSLNKRASGMLWEWRDSAADNHNNLSIRSNTSSCLSMFGRVSVSWVCTDTMSTLIFQKSLRSQQVKYPTIKANFNARKV